MSDDPPKVNYKALLIDDECEKYRINIKDFVKDKKRKEIISGFGTVSFYTRKKDNLKCVVKKTNHGIADEASQRSFYREIEALVKCVHPTIVPFIGFCEEKKNGIIVLAEAKNGSLQSYIENIRKGKVDPRFNNTTKFIISYGIAKSMELFHKDNRIHRDLKPGNVLLDENLYPLLTDFGTSKKLESVKQVNQTLSQSTAPIMSPEFIKEPEKYSNTKEIDVYAYGMTIYELWTEIIPYSHIKAAFMIMKAVSEGERPSIPESTPETWKDLIESCWDENIEERPKFSEIIAAFDSGKFYTDDMDLAAIEAYKKTIAVDSILSSASTPTPTPKPEQEKIYETVEPEPSIIPEGENPILTKMRDQAKSGDFNSQFNLVIALVEGTYGEPNYDEALKFSRIYLTRKGAFDKENQKNSATIGYYEGRCYAQKNDYNSASRILKQSLMQGCNEAAFLLAELMFDQKVKYRPAELMAFYERAAIGGIPEAIKKYAFILYYGTITGHPDKKKSLQFIQMGSDQGDPELMHEWAVRLEFGRGVEKDITQAMELIKLSADKGYGPAMVDYGIHLLNGIHIEQNENEAKECFKSAASQNEPWGQLWYYIMSKESELIDTNNDEDLSEYLTKSLQSNQVPEAWAVYGKAYSDVGNIDDALSSLFYSCSCGCMYGFLTLGEICEENPQYGDPNYYFQLASNYCHCVDDCGFTTPLQYKMFHCRDCNIDLCEGCAKYCHDQNHDIVEAITQRGFKCHCGKNGFQNKCTAEFVGEVPCFQHLYQCATCCIQDDTKYICKSCAENCHKGHQIIDCGVMRNFCSCGNGKLPYNFRCHLLNYDKSEGCSCGKCKQRWFQCVQCGLYGSIEVGICEKCKTVCHDSHSILDLGVNEATCSCRNANCFLQGD